MYSVNDIFIHKTPKTNKELFVIKGAWAKTKNGDCWLTRKDGTGHCYTGKVTHVEDVFNITEEEFKEMTGDHIEWFERDLFEKKVRTIIEDFYYHENELMKYLSTVKDEFVADVIITLINYIKKKY